MNVVLVMFKGTDRRDFPLNEERTVLGRRQDCHLRIPTRDVSRQHCELLKKPGGLHAKDLGSSNGTFVNGKRIAEAQLKPGDRLRVGPVTFAIQIDGQPKDIKPEEGATPTEVTPTAGTPEDEKTFDLGEAELLDDPLSALEEPEDDDDKNAP